MLVTEAPSFIHPPTAPTTQVRLNALPTAAGESRRREKYIVAPTKNMPYLPVSLCGDSKADALVGTVEEDDVLADEHVAQNPQGTGGRRYVCAATREGNQSIDPKHSNIRTAMTREAQTPWQTK